MDKFMHIQPSLLSETIADKIEAAEQAAAKSKSAPSGGLNEKVVQVYKKYILIFLYTGSVCCFRVTSLENCQKLSRLFHRFRIGTTF